MNQVPPPNDGYRYFHFGTLSEPSIFDEWIIARNTAGEYRKMHRHKYPRANEVLQTLQLLEGKEVILRTRITGDYEFDPSRVYFSDVYPADELAEGWPRDGDRTRKARLCRRLRITMRQHEAALENANKRLQRYRTKVEQELNETFQKLSKAEKIYKQDVWNSRLERLLEYDPNILDEVQKTPG